VAAPRKPTSATGGRLVSLVDGREYLVPDAGVTFGREIGNDIVIPSGEISRRHAQITASAEGYVLTDLSTNGVRSNGVRVAQRQVLGRGDVIRLANEEFRFYADKAKESAVSAPPPASAATAAPAPAAAPSPPAQPAATAPPAAPRAPIPATASAPAASMPPAAPSPPAPKPASAPAAAAPAAPPVAEGPTEPKPIGLPPRTPLATLEVVNEGPIKGTKFEIFTPLTNVGRGAHNDVSIADESVSESHAKIIRRDGRWLVMDQGSTNGTYVGGRRVLAEQPLVGAPDVRFGNVKLTFRPSAATADVGGSTRVIAPISTEEARRRSTQQGMRASGVPAPASVAAKENAVAAADVPVPAKKQGCAAMIAFVIAAGAAGAGVLGLLLSVRG
jgi:pSer/pThr/pTyr-binding forkhead associated (FHA) protein